jgi:hypothetical protein
MPAFIDRTGKRFNRWTVLGRAPNGHRGVTRWLCRCDCGTERAVWSPTLVNGTSKSCGCYNSESSAKRHAIHWGKASRNRLVYQYRASARKRKYPWTLTQEETHRLFEANCYYCGSKPKQVYKAKECHGPYVYNGIDRVDSSLGYTPDNCVPCCWVCNFAKRKMTKDVFLAWVRRVYTYAIQRRRQEEVA